MPTITQMIIGTIVVVGAGLFIAGVLRWLVDLHDPFDPFDDDIVPPDEDISP